MSSSSLANKEKSATKPHHKMQGHTGTIYGIIGLPDKQRKMTCSGDGSLRVWDLESGKQVGGAWKDEGSEFEAVLAIALSPDGKTVASGSQSGTVRLWNIDTGKVMKKWTADTDLVQSFGWSPDGRRVVGGSYGGGVRVWDVRSGETIIGSIETGQGNIVWAVCYSPDGKMIVTGADGLQVWDANTGELLKTLGITVSCLTWASGGSILIAGSQKKIRIFDTAAWTEIAVLDGHEKLVNGISLSPNECILASVSDDNTARLWNLKSNLPIGPPIHHEYEVRSVSLDGKFLATGCYYDHHIYIWDASVIVEKAGFDNLLSDNVNVVDKSVLNAGATRRRAPQIEGARRIPQGFFDDSSTLRGHQTAPPRQPNTPLSWAQNFVSGMLRRRDGSGVLLPPIVEVPLTAGKPRDYYARKKRSANSSQLPKPHTAQQPSGGATQSNPSSSQQPPATAASSTTPPAVAGTAGAAGTNLDITIRQAGWRARFLLWVCCVPIQNAGSQP